MEKKLITSLLGAILSMLLTCIAVLLFVTLAKYSDRLDGYVDMGVAEFNAAIKPTDITVQEGETEKIINVTYSTQDFKPGMYSKELGNAAEDEEDTSATTKFRIQNGTTGANAARMDLQYTIRIRTSNSLPLKYTLKTIDGETVTYHKSLTEPETVREPMSEPRYEYQFHEEASEGDTESQAEPTEMIFILTRGTDAEPLMHRDHELIAEWAAEGELSKPEYMKEVEIVEILVTVMSVNQSENDDYQQPSNPDVNEYGNGIIVILPEAGEDEYDYSYDVDLRSFEQTGAAEDEPIKSEFEFTIHNGYGLGLGENPPITADYDLELKVPAEIIEAEDDSWSFGLYRKGVENASDLLADATLTYRVYDEKTGELYGEYATLAEVPSFEQPRYKLYYIYTIALDDSYILNYQQEDNAGNYAPVKDMHDYRLTANNFAAEDYEPALVNKLEITVKVIYGPIPTE